MNYFFEKIQRLAQHPSTELVVHEILRSQVDRTRPSAK